MCRSLGPIPFVIPGFGPFPAVFVRYAVTTTWSSLVACMEFSRFFPDIYGYGTRLLRFVLSLRYLLDLLYICSPDPAIFFEYALPGSLFSQPTARAHLISFKYYPQKRRQLIGLVTDILLDSHSNFHPSDLGKVTLVCLVIPLGLPTCGCRME